MSIRGQSVLAIIQARSGSTRLPQKVLRKIAGRPSLYYVIQRVRRSRVIDKLVLATTTKSRDDAVAAIGYDLNIPVFRGGEDDVLGRFVSCLDVQENDYHLLVRVNADNILICPEVIDAALERLVHKNLDVVNPFMNNTYPFGAGAEVAKVSTLREVARRVPPKASKYREHIFFYAYEHPKNFSVDTLPAPTILTRPGLNISVDTAEQFDTVRLFLEILSEDERISCSTSEIIHYFDNI